MRYLFPPVPLSTPPVMCKPSARGRAVVSGVPPPLSPSLVPSKSLWCQESLRCASGPVILNAIWGFMTGHPSGNTRVGNQLRVWEQGGKHISPRLRQSCLLRSPSERSAEMLRKPAVPALGTRSSTRPGSCWAGSGLNNGPRGAGRKLSREDSNILAEIIFDLPSSALSPRCWGESLCGSGQVLAASSELRWLPGPVGTAGGGGGGASGTFPWAGPL